MKIESLLPTLPKLALGLALLGAPSPAATADDGTHWPELPEGWSGALLAGAADGHRVRAAGMADLAGIRPVTPDTRFNVASASKMLTAVAIAQLHESGRLDFDDPIGRHLPDLPPVFARRTVRQLLSHSAGFGEILKRENAAALAAARSATELLPLALVDEPGPSGTFAYSNAGYIVLGAIIERLSGQRYEEYVGQHIFAPAAMAGSTFESADGDAEGIVREGEGSAVRISEHTQRRGSSAGGAFMSVEDMYRFAHALLAGRLVSPGTLAEMLRPHVVVRPATADRPGTAWGLGFGLSGFGQDLVFGHSGGAPGIDVFVRLAPATGRVAIVFSNQSLEQSSRLSRVLLAGKEGKP